MKLLLSSLIIILSFQLNASHVVGGHVGYAPTGNLNEYVLTLTLYRDCSGINAPTSVSIQASNDCGLVNPVLTLSLITSSEISQLCPYDLPNSTCNNGTLPGIQKYIYEDTLILSGGCNYWTFGYNVCDRNASTNLDGVGCFYIETTLDNADFPLNSSPIITNLYQVPYVCNNLPVDISSYIVDANLDSLNFSFVNAMSLAGTNIGYLGGFSASSPIPGITINQTTGQIQFTPTINGIFVVTILIEELDQYGNIIGTMMHDFEFIVETCTNNPPTHNNTISNFNNFGSNASLQPNGSIELCSGDQFCFDYVFTDADLGDSLVLSSDILSNFPGATFTQTGNNPATASICWPFQSNYTSSSFSVYATDNVCPIPGVSSKTFGLTLPPPIKILNDSIYSCLGLTPQNASANTNLNLYWTDLNGDTLNIGSEISCNPCSNPQFFFSSSAQVIAKANTNCTVSDTLTIIIGTAVNADFANDTSYICQGDSIVFQSPSPSAFNTWNNSLSQDSIVVTSPSTPIYVFLESELNGCTSYDTTIVIQNLLPTPLIQVSSSGLTTSSYSNYQWIYNNSPISGATNQNLTPLSNGYYQVEVVDSNGCSNISPYFSIVNLGLENNNQQHKIYKIAENVIIEIEDENQIAEIYNLNGKLIIKQTLKSNKNIISVPNSHQIYLIKIINQKGELTCVKKL